MCLVDAVLAERLLSHACVILDEQVALSLVMRSQVLLGIRTDSRLRATLLEYAIISISSFLLFLQHLLIPEVHEALEHFLDVVDGPLYIPCNNLDFQGFELSSLLS